MNAAPGPARSAAPYSVLAAGYDVVMEHVAYDEWAAYIHELFQAHHPGVDTVLELGCGTGSLALELQPLGPYRYLATDGAAPMVRVARAKAELLGADVQFAEADFTNFRVDPPVDAVVLLYDGMNYLLEEEQVAALLAGAYRALQPGGLFVFDQSTPENSIQNEAYFEDAGQVDAFSYVRSSRYDRTRRLHTTTFEITIDDAVYREEHLERAYTLAEVRALVAETDFEVAAAYDGFSDDPAGEASERIHWVLRKAEGRSSKFEAEMP